MSIAGIIDKVTHLAQTVKNATAIDSGNFLRGQIGRGMGLEAIAHIVAPQQQVADDVSRVAIVRGHLALGAYVVNAEAVKADYFPDSRRPLL